MATQGKQARSSARTPLQPRIVNGPTVQNGESSPPGSQSKRKGNNLDTNQSSKRQRTGKKGKERRNDLCLLPTVPLDIITEIFGYLSIEDLIRLSQVSPSFERALDVDMASVWRASRSAKGVPEPPKGVSERLWATLLLEVKQECESCGERKVPREKIDWAIMKRVCGHCKLKHLVGPRDSWFKKEFPDYDEKMFDFIPYTNNRPYTRETYDHDFKNRKLYWKADVHALAKRWANLRGATDTPSGQECFEKWKEEQLECVQACKKAGEFGNLWFERYDEMKAAAERARALAKKELKIQGFRLKFQELGYTAHDIDIGLSRVSDDELKSWDVLKSSADNRIRIAKTLSEIRQLEPIRSARRMIPMALYWQYLERLRPSQRWCCPPSAVLLTVPVVRKIIEADKNVNITARDFAPVVAMFPTMIADYHWLRARAAVQSIAGEAQPGRMNPRAMKQLEQVIQLARHVFVCGNGQDSKVICGLQLMKSHQCDDAFRRMVEIHPGVYAPSGHCRVVLHARTSQLAYELIKVAGLDPATATNADMDARDARFAVVKHDLPVFWYSHYGVFTWRAALSWFTYHFENDGYGHSFLPKFRLATAKEEADAKHASSHRLLTAKLWSCNHCLVFSNAHQTETRSVILYHLQQRHGIITPKLHQDYLIQPCHWVGIHVPHYMPFRATSEPYECLRCQKRRDKRRDLGEIRRHFVSVHNMQDAPIEGKHFTLAIDCILDYPE